MPAKKKQTKTSRCTSKKLTRETKPKATKPKTSAKPKKVNENAEKARALNLIKIMKSKQAETEKFVNDWEAFTHTKEYKKNPEYYDKKFKTNFNKIEKAGDREYDEYYKLMNKFTITTKDLTKFKGGFTDPNFVEYMFAKQK